MEKLYLSVKEKDFLLREEWVTEQTGTSLYPFSLGLEKHDPFPSTEGKGGACPHLVLRLCSSNPFTAHLIHPLTRGPACSVVFSP